MKTKILFKNLFIFSDGSSFFDFTFFYGNSKPVYLKKDLKKIQNNLKKKTKGSISDLNNTTTYRKKLFK